MSKITQELVSLCVEGHVRSQSELYTELKPKLVGFITKRLNYEHRDDVDSILSIAFTRIFKCLHQFNFEGSFDGWCCIIAGHAISDYYRRPGMVFVSVEEISDKHLHGMDYFDYQIKDNTPYNDGESDMIMNDYISLIKQLLTTKEFSIFMLAYEGFSHKEIGDKLSISEGTSKWHLNKLRNKIKKHETFAKINTNI